jgi:hypothetical protein
LGVERWHLWSNKVLNTDRPSSSKVSSMRLDFVAYGPAASCIVRRNSVQVPSSSIGQNQTVNDSPYWID